MRTTTVSVVSYGGGVNSLAMLIGMHERLMAPDAIVFSDTRGEKPETYDHIERHLRPWLTSIGFPELTVVCRADSDRTKTGDASLEAECLRLGTLPSRAYGFGTCADKWKIDPFKWWAQEHHVDHIVARAIGYDADEHYRVSDNPDPKWPKWYPLLEWNWDRDACAAAARRVGLPVPPKSACFFCPSSKKHELVQLRKRHPELAERAALLEDNGMKGAQSVKGLGRNFSWRGFFDADERQQELFPEAIVEECGACVT